MNPIYQYLNSLPSNGEGLYTGLDAYRLFEIKGPDAEKFLQGQLTADLATLKTRGYSLAAHCSIKGHMISLFRLFRLSDNHFIASIHQSIAETGVNNLKKYSIFSKVELSFLNNWSGIALDSQHLNRLDPQSDSTSDDPIDIKDGGFIAKIDHDLYELWAENAVLEPQVHNGPDKTTGPDSWNLALIQRGIPALYSETQEHFIPQMVNLQALEGVSFTKGCYTGQEIVTRLQHRGILKKAMYHYRIAGTPKIQPGNPILNSQDEEIGELVVSAVNSAGDTELLAVINQSQINSGAELKLASEEKLEALELPYTLDTRLFEKKR